VDDRSGGFAGEEELIGIGRANVNGTGIDSTFIDPHFGSGEAIALAAGSAHLYYEAAHGEARSNLDGSGAEDNFLPGAGRSLAVNSSHVYWGDPERSALRLHKAIRHKRRGTATLPMDVFGPGELVLSGTGLQRVTRTIESSTALEKLPVRPKGRKRHRLERRGHVKVTADVTFTLMGADPTTQSKTLRLVRR
jgi:hypothetical protein